MRLSSKIQGLLVVFLLSMTGTAQAASILVDFLGSAPTGTGTYEFTYTAQLTSDSYVQSGDFFSIIDFAGYVDGTVSSSNPLFTATTAPTTDAPFQAPPDSAAVVNLVFTYNGALPLVGPVLSLGTFTAESIYSLPNTQGFYEGQDRDLTPDPGATGIQGNSGTTTVPAIPLPAAAWGGLGLLGMLGAARVRKARKA